MDIIKELRKKYYTTDSVTGLGVYKEPHVSFEDLNICLNEIQRLRECVKLQDEIHNAYDELAPRLCSEEPIRFMKDPRVTFYDLIEGVKKSTT